MTPKHVILLCLATEKGREVLREAAGYRDRCRFAVSTFCDTAVSEDHSAEIEATARQAGDLFIPAAQLRSSFLECVVTHQIEAALCIGWRYLVPTAVRERLNGQVYVAHDSLLPRYRGFAPLPTAMIAGDRETGVTLLQAGDTADDGPIYWQERVPIEPDDTIASMIRKVLPLYRRAAGLLFASQLPQPVPQDESQATYSIWRDEDDYQLDWTQDAARLERTVRALGLPYTGARTTLRGQSLIVHRASVMPDVPFAIRQPGKVWSLDAEGRPTVVCGQGLLRVDAATLNGHPALPFKSLRVRLGS